MCECWSHCIHSPLCSHLVSTISFVALQTFILFSFEIFKSPWHIIKATKKNRIQFRDIEYCKHVDQWINSKWNVDFSLVIFMLQQSNSACCLFGWIRLICIQDISMFTSNDFKSFEIYVIFTDSQLNRLVDYLFW